MKSDLTIKEKIINSAIKVLSHDGYSGLTLTAVANAAKITKQSLRYHFSDMDHLTLEIAKIWSKTGQDITIKELAEHKYTEVYRILSIAEAMFLWIEKHYDLSRAGLAMILAKNSNSKLISFMNESRRVGLARIETIIKDHCYDKKIKIDAKTINTLALEAHMTMYGSYFYTCASGTNTKSAMHEQICLSSLKRLIESKLV